MKQAHIFISGHVQGVGFRQFVRSQAKRLGITGWVTNLPDGRVEAVLQGKDEKLAVLLSICQRGPMISSVNSVEIKWEEPSPLFPDFQKRK